MTERRAAPVRDPYRAVFEVGATVASTLDLDEVLRSVAQQVAAALAVQQCDIHDYDPEADTLTCAAIWSKDANEEDEAWIGHVTHLEDRPARREVLETRAPVEAYADDDALPAEERAIMLEWHELATMEVPLLYGDDVIGVLGVCDMERMRRFTPDEVRLLQLLAGPAAIAIHNARVFRDRAERTKRLAAVVDASRAITSSLDLDEVLQRVAQQATDVMGVSQGAIYEFRPEMDAMLYRAVYALYSPPDSPEDDPLGTPYPLDECPTDREILRAGEIVVERLSDPDLSPDRRVTMEPWHEKTVLSLPLIFRREPIGILRLYDMVEERHFDPEEIDLLRSIGELASAALHNARLYREQAEQSGRLLGLFETSQALNSTFEVDQLVQGIAEGASGLLEPSASTAVWLRDGDETLVRSDLLRDDDDDAGRVAELSPLALEAIERQLPAHHSAVPGSALVVPFVRRERVEGFADVSLPGFRAFAQPEIEALQVLANQAAVALANAGLYRQVQRLAVRDGLTGLFNHRHFQEQLAQEVARAARYGLPLSLLMIDVDDFKRFNDEHGHQLGDEVLREVARIVQANVRRGIDLPARYGGEEFAVVLPHTTVSGAARVGRRLHERLEQLEDELPPAGDGATVVGERLREAVEERRFAGHGGRRYAHLTVSIGIACLEQAGDAEGLVQCADKALYVAKRGGKDRVEVFGA